MIDAIGDELLLTIDETARRLGLSRSTIRNLIDRGELPTLRIGRSVRIPADSLQAWMRSRLGVPRHDLTMAG